MKIAIIQFEPALKDPELSWTRLQPLLDAASACELIVLPELASSGYAFADRKEAEEVAEETDGPFLTRLRDFCRRNGGWIASGFCEREGDRLFNSAALVGAEGLVGLYRKLHLFDSEKRFFTPGNLGLPVFDIGIAKVGLLVCFDWMFPEAWRSLMLRGAEIIAHPANLVLPGRCQRAVPVRAMTQRIFVATANRIGAEASLHFTGESLLADPSGEVLARAGASEPCVLQVEIDPAIARDKRITDRNSILGDRRTDVYGLGGVDLQAP